MRSMDFSGRNVDEAIFHGLIEMGLSIDEVTTEIIQRESKGLFGIGAKNAIVRITEREVPVTPVFDTVPRPEQQPKKRGEGRGERKSSKKTEPRRQTPQLAYDDTLAETNEAARFLRELLAAMKIEGTVQAAETEDGLRLNILSQTDGLLIGRRGETLDAIQYLVSLYWNRDRKENAYRRVSVDTEGYRARREETLRKLARRTAAQVAKTGRPVTMEPMNPYERRILHSALQGFTGVTTYSEGEEPNRCVIVAPEE